MNQRDRVLAAFRHEEPDRVPIDFGGTMDSTMSALTYQNLRRELGLPPTVTRVQDVVQYTAVIEDDVREALGIDTLPVLDQPLEWRTGRLSDGTPAEFPALFRPQEKYDGSQVVLDRAGTTLTPSTPPWPAPRTGATLDRSWPRSRGMTSPIIWT